MSKFILIKERSFCFFIIVYITNDIHFTAIFTRLNIKLEHTKNAHFNLLVFCVLYFVLFFFQLDHWFGYFGTISMITEQNEIKFMYVNWSFFNMD